MARLLRATADARGAPCVLVRQRGFAFLVLRPNEIGLDRSIRRLRAVAWCGTRCILIGADAHGPWSEGSGSHGFVRIHRSRLVKLGPARVKRVPPLDVERESVVVLKDRRQAERKSDLPEGPSTAPRFHQLSFDRPFVARNPVLGRAGEVAGSSKTAVSAM